MCQTTTPTESNQKSSGKWLTSGVGQRRYMDSLKYFIVLEARKTNENMAKGPRSQLEATPTSLYEIIQALKRIINNAGF